MEFRFNSCSKNLKAFVTALVEFLLNSSSEFVNHDCGVSVLD